MAGVFINYRGDDSQLSGALIFNALADAFGEENVFLDSRSIRIGDDFADVLLRRLRESGTVLAVIGARWLTEADDSGEPRIAREDDWVRRELAEAFRLGIRVIPVLIDNARLPRETELTPDIAELSRHQYLHLRRRYTKEDLSSLVARLKEVDDALAVISTRRSDRTPRVPRELPSMPSYFVGRSEQLGQLSTVRAQAGSEDSALFVVTGMGGIGKTALAVKWARDARSRFADGDLYVDLRGFGEERPLDPADVLSGFLRVLGVDGTTIPNELERRSALFRSIVSSRRLLILLDNAASEDQVRPLLPASPDAMVIVTSRLSLGGLIARDGATRIEVGALTMPEALQLFESLIGDRVEADMASAEALARRCARLPLALRIVAERAAERPSVSLRALLAELPEDADWLEALDSGEATTKIRAVFSWSYRLLAADQARTFRLCGLQPCPTIGVAALTALLDRTTNETRHAVGDLVRAHLIDEVTPQRYALHDLLKSYASELSAVEDSEDERNDARLRLYDHYLAKVGAAMWVIAPHESDRLPERSADHLDANTHTYREAFGYLERERAAILACVRQATSIASRLDSVFVMAAARALFRFLETRAYDDDSLSLHRMALAAAKRVGDPAAIASVLADLGVSYERVDQFDEALKTLAQAVSSATEAHEWNTAARALNGRGAALNQLGRHEEALQHHEYALRLVVADGIPAREGHARGNIGLTLQLMGRVDDSIDNYRKAIEAFTAQHNLTAQGRTLNNLGAAYRILGNEQDAWACFEEAIRIARRGGNRRIEVAALNGLGDVATATGRPAEALEYHRLALAIAAEYGDRRLAPAHIGLAIAYRALGDIENSERHSDLARQYPGRVGRPPKSEPPNPVSVVT